MVFYFGTAKVRKYRDFYVKSANKNWSRIFRSGTANFDIPQYFYQPYELK